MEIKLRDLIETLPCSSVDGSLEIDIKGISCDSRSVRDGDLFVAIKGERFDGHNLVKLAIDKGGKAIVLEKGVLVNGEVTKILVRNCRVALSRLAARFYGDPSSKIKMIGITGTNGKTTTSYLVEKILSEEGFNCGLIGTISYKVRGRVIQANNTTPGPIELQLLLREMVMGRSDYAIIEVSSHSLAQHRVDDVAFDRAVFTNLTIDHLDYHKTIDGYFDAKMKLFKNLAKDSLAILNIDDPYGRLLAHRTRARVMTYGIDGFCDVRAQILNSSLDGTEFRLRSQDEAVDVAIKLIGRYNVYNALGAACVGLSQSIGLDHIAKALEGFVGAPGRLERIECGQPFELFIDYAHTDNALSNILSTLKEKASGRLISVFGCGGDRDRIKRPLMGEVAQRYSDYVILTSDNPRNEDPSDIVHQIEEGMVGDKNYMVILDRYEAIREALAMARDKDIVVICGKGHEQFQVFGDRKVPFDDRQVAREILNEH